MNFGAIGETMAFGHVMKTVAQRADRQTDQANDIIERKNQEIEALEREVSRLKSALNVQLAQTEGVLAQARVARRELTAVAPKHPLLKKTGKRYENGAEQLEFQKIFEVAFDKKATELGLPGPVEKYRLSAK